MAVPDTNTFSLEDVRVELGLASNTSLTACFAASVDASFDVAYKGSKDRLSNFRNYGATPVAAVLGYLYNYWAYRDTNFAPTGWHIPTPTELTVLGEYLDPSGTWNVNVAGTYMKEAGTAHWFSNPDGTNSSGFTGRGAGQRVHDTGVFANKGLHHIFPTSGDSGSSVIIGGLIDALTRFNYYKLGGGFSFTQRNEGVSVRFVKDNTTNPGTITDYDGNVYDCVTIGSQVWTVQNWKCTRLNNGTPIPTVTDAGTWSGLSTLAKCAYDNDEGNV